MTVQIVTVLAILGVAIILFITERVRADVIGLMVLVALALAGLVTPSEALSGFSSPAVVTVWAVLILSSGLARTGVAGLIGRPMIKLAGYSIGFNSSSQLLSKEVNYSCKSKDFMDVYKRIIEVSNV